MDRWSTVPWPGVITALLFAIAILYIIGRAVGRVMTREGKDYLVNMVETQNGKTARDAGSHVDQHPEELDLTVREAQKQPFSVSDNHPFI